MTYLIASLVVARVNTHRFVKVGSLGRAVQAHVVASSTKVANLKNSTNKLVINTCQSFQCSHLSGSNRFAGHKQFRVDILEEPMETMTFQIFSQLLPGGNVAKVALLFE